MVSYMELQLRSPNQNGAGTMKLSHITAFAIAACIGISTLGASPAQAGRLGEFVGKVGNKVGEKILGVKPAKKGKVDYWACISHWTNGGKNAVTPGISTACERAAKSS